jgi:phage gp46-like protein
MATSSAIKLGDLALTWSVATGDADLSIIDDDLASDRGLETAVLLSLFTDRRSEDDDKPPSGDPNDRRGWWADQFAVVEGDQIGSRLWLLDRSVITGETARRAEEYVREALAWMIEDRVVSSIGVEIETTKKDLFIGVTLARPGKDPVRFRFDHVWDAITP